MRLVKKIATPTTLSVNDSQEFSHDDVEKPLAPQGFSQIISEQKASQPCSAEQSLDFDSMIQTSRLTPT